MISVQIYSIEGLIFEGEVAALTSYNEEGEFDILPHHANFISIIQDKLILRLPDQEKKSFSLELGVIKHQEEKTKVYLGLEAELLNLDVPAAE
jgi:F0F1-type ATP synthase epsilon subunit